jgi:hypothetical protein
VVELNNRIKITKERDIELKDGSIEIIHLNKREKYFLKVISDSSTYGTISKD